MDDKSTIRENEGALIGSVLKGGVSVYQRVKDIVKPETFDNTSYGLAWKAIDRLFERGMGIDTVTVGDEMQRAGNLESFGDGSRGGRLLLSDMRMTGNPIHVEAYAENVQDYHVKKKLEILSQKAYSWSKNGRRAPDIIQDVLKEIGEFSIYSSKAQDHIYDLRKMSSMAYDESADASNGKVRSVLTGLLDLDVLLNGGLRKGNLILGAARPGMGKTALIVTVIRNLIKMGGRMVLFSLEMTAVEIMQRILAQETEIDLDRIIRGKMNKDEWGRFNEAVAYFANMKNNLVVIDMPALKIGNIRQLARQEFAKEKFDLLCVDYIQLANSDNKNERRQLDIGEVSRGLKALAKELDLPVFAAAQLNRAVEQRADKRPILSDLREAGDLEQDSDVIIFIHRPEIDTNGATDLIVAKHRNGQTNTVSTIYRAPLTRFDNAATRIERFG